MHEKSNPDTYSKSDIIGMLIGPEAGIAAYILISTFLLYYYTNVVGLQVTICSSLIFASKFFDGTTDVIFGFILDRTKSKLGPCRAWTVRICVPYAIMFALLFAVPGNSGVWPYVYVFLTYNFMVGIFHTIGDISENSLPTFITRNAKGRALLFTCKGLCAGITAYIVANNTINWVEKLGGDKSAWFKLALIIGVVGICTKLIMVLLTTERVKIDEMTGGTKPKIIEIISAIRKNKYWFFTMIILCMGGCIQVGTASLATYYAQYVLGDISLTGKILSAFLLPPIAGFIISGILMQKYQRKTVIIGAVLIGLLGSILSIIGGSLNWVLLLVGLACRGLSYSMIMVTTNTMTADTVEYGQWKTGVRAQGVLMSAKGLGEKIASGLLGAIIGWIMGAAGYNGMLKVQPDSAIRVINGLFLYTPLVLISVIALFIVFYDLDKIYPTIITELEERESKLKEMKE